ncbi:uncharacterized protein LOC103519639 [Diaphorina citri]|uniref:Uncharacterized protein LOC103519639 n=1 Tax=Diaphorina citri TaxID=121845 RepID=A0A1S4ENW5_DIACI|nr:uncharacterized protein LOC103519639 [Diaphorina citri]
MITNRPLTTLMKLVLISVLIQNLAAQSVNLLSNIVSVVRTSDDHTPEITEEDLEKKLSPAEEETQLESLMEHQVDKFMDNHVIRLKLPEGITAGLTNSNKGRSYSIAGNALDISLARMFSIVEGVNLLSNIVSVVRTSDDHTPEITEEDLEKKLSPAEEETQLESLMEHQVDKFMDNHVIRLKLPEGITAGLTNSNKGRSYSIAGNALDISLARMFSIVEGRGKGGGGGGGKMKGMKKMMGMMMMGVMGKLAMLMPMMMMMLKMKAMKALIIAKLALALSLIQVFKMMMSGGGKGKMGGGGSKEVIIVHDNHGDSGSSGGGWSSGGGSSGGGWSSGGSSGKW